MRKRPPEAFSIQVHGVVLVIGELIIGGVVAGLVVGRLLDRTSRNSASKTRASREIVVDTLGVLDFIVVHKNGVVPALKQSVDMSAEFVRLHVSVETGRNVGRKVEGCGIRR